MDGQRLIKALKIPITKDLGKRNSTATKVIALKLTRLI